MRAYSLDQTNKAEDRVRAASQYDRSFSPHKLGNWEIPAAEKMAQPQFSTVPARNTKTKFIADDKGYLKKEFKKPGVTAFSTTAECTRPVYSDTKPRWPKVRVLWHRSAWRWWSTPSVHDCICEQENVSWPFAPRAVMPSKGIQTGYLPISTVPVQTYMSEGFRDFNFHN